MTWLSTKLQSAAGISSRKFQVVVLVLLVSHLACDAHSISECCKQNYHSCRLYMLLCHSGSSGTGRALSGDASAGILTLGKREGEELRLQSRLNQLLQVSRNQAAGILTMGKRTGEVAQDQYIPWLSQSETAFTTSLPV